MARIRAIATRVGGGFGGKHASNIHSIAAWLARAARRPVKLVLSRMQDFEVQRSRHPARIWMSTGARRDGTILARDVRIDDRRRRVRRREPAGAGVRPADVARPVPHSECARAGRGRLHQQAARRLVPRFRQSAGELRGRVADRRPRQRRSASIPVELRLRNAMRAGRHGVRRPAGGVLRCRAMPDARARRAACGAAAAAARRTTPRRRLRRDDAHLRPDGHRPPPCSFAPTARSRWRPAASTSARAPTR